MRSLLFIYLLITCNFIRGLSVGEGKTQLDTGLKMSMWKSGLDATEEEREWWQRYCHHITTRCKLKLVVSSLSAIPVWFIKKIQELYGHKSLVLHGSDIWLESCIMSCLEERRVFSASQVEQQMHSHWLLWIVNGLMGWLCLRRIVVEICEPDPL